MGTVQACVCDMVCSMHVKGLRSVVACNTCNQPECIVAVLNIEACQGLLQGFRKQTHLAMCMQT